MKRITGALLATALTLTACGGSTPDTPARDDIAALDEGRGKDAPAKGGDKGDPKADKATKKNPAGGKRAGNALGNGGGAQTSPGGGGGGTQPSTGDEGSDPPAGPQAAAPVPQGRYEYDTEGTRTVSNRGEKMPETTTLTAAAPAEGLQRQTRDLRDPDGNGILTETDLLYRPDGVFLSYVKITSRFQGGLTDVREFRLPRPQLIAPAGAGPGTTRTFRMEGSGTRAKVTIRAHRYENVEAAGDQVRTLFVQTDIVFSGALEGNQRSHTWFQPKHLLPVKEQVHTDVRNGPIRVQSSYEAVIRRLP